MKIGVVDYGAGNLNSVLKAFRSLNTTVHLVSTEDDLTCSDRLVLPGVGSFGHAAEALEKSGLLPSIRTWIMEGRPFLGICLGMQLLVESSAEKPDSRGLAVWEGTCRRFTGPRVPQMGWNSVEIEKESPLFHGLENGDYFYFVHSYYVDPVQDDIVLAQTEYTCRFPSVAGAGRAYGIQFHPEKSGDKGLQMLKNWTERC